jgi:uncharacterized membrane protein YeaQ/YmgE (transglycosylase-associated protein family)
MLLLVAGICGSVAQALAGYTHGGCLASVVLGLIGALLGTWLARFAGLPDMLTIRIDGRAFPIVWTILGAALFSAALGMMGRRRRMP